MLVSNSPPLCLGIYDPAPGRTSVKKSLDFTRPAERLSGERPVQIRATPDRVLIAELRGHTGCVPRSFPPNRK